MAGFRDQLHVAVFDPVMHHLHIVTCAISADVGYARFTVFSHSSDFGQDRSNQFVGFFLATRHDGWAFQCALFTAGNTGTDEVEAFS